MMVRPRARLVVAAEAAVGCGTTTSGWAVDGVVDLATEVTGAKRVVGTLRTFAGVPESAAAAHQKCDTRRFVRQNERFRGPRERESEQEPVKIEFEKARVRAREDWRSSLHTHPGHVCRAAAASKVTLEVRCAPVVMRKKVA